MSELKDESFFNDELPEKKQVGFKWVMSGWMTKLNKFSLRMNSIEINEIKKARNEDNIDKEISEKPIANKKNQLF